MNMLTAGRISDVENIAMTTMRTKGRGAIVGVLAISAVILALPARGRSQVSGAAPAVAAPDVQAAIPGSQSASASGRDASPPAKKSLEQRVKSIVQKLTPERIKRNREFKQAAVQFPDFCKHWEQDLHERELNNVAKLNFSLKAGFETATYTGYGKITGCESHQSKDGYSIGKLSYEEFIYYVVGKTREGARSDAPKTISDTHTTEIFRWENKKWFY